MKFQEIPKVLGIRFRRQGWILQGQIIHCWINRDEPTMDGITWWQKCYNYDEQNTNLSAFDLDRMVLHDDWEYFQGPTKDPNGEPESLPAEVVKSTFEHKAIGNLSKPKRISEVIQVTKSRFIQHEIRGAFKRVTQISTGYEAWVLLSDLSSNGIEVAFYDGFQKRYHP